MKHNRTTITNLVARTKKLENPPSTRPQPVYRCNPIAERNAATQSRQLGIAYSATHRALHDPEKKEEVEEEIYRRSKKVRPKNVKICRGVLVIPTPSFRRVNCAPVPLARLHVCGMVKGAYAAYSWHGRMKWCFCGTPRKITLLLGQWKCCRWSCR